LPFLSFRHAIGCISAAVLLFGFANDFAIAQTSAAATIGNDLDGSAQVTPSDELPLNSPPTLSVVTSTQDLLISNFEDATFGTWTMQGDAFRPGPTMGEVSGQKVIRAFEGQRLANSAAGGLLTTGRLLSPYFTIERTHIRFLIGGAELPDKTCLNLLIDNTVVRTATGLKSKTGRAETLRYEDWDVSDIIGKTVQLEIVDDSTDPFGYVLVDDILQTDNALEKPSVKLAAIKHYLLLPVKNNARMVQIQLASADNVVRDFQMELADGKAPDWWASLDISEFAGKTITIRSPDKLPPELANQFLSQIRQSDRAVEATDLYREAGRPQFHYTVARGYNNDPNGLVFFNGKYHMFYQNNPFGTDWGNMRWGHAVSADLLHWTELGTAIYPHGASSPAFSGGALVDHGNTLGFGQGKEDVLVASYACIGRGECIAFGTGDALSLTDIPQDPVLKHSGWDPNVMRYRPDNKWLMVVFEKRLPKFGYAFYDSTDVISWHRLGMVEGFQDCPDFFELSVEGENTHKWVLYGSKKIAANRYASRSSYMIGTFDGQKFTPESEILEGEAGPQFYAGQTFKDMPDGRRVMLGWLSGASYSGMPFSQGMTVPLELKLRRTSQGIRLAFTPIKEIDRLHGRQFPVGKNLTIAAANTSLSKVDAELLDCAFVIRTGAAGHFKMSIHGLTLSYDAATKELSSRGTKIIVEPNNGQLSLRILVDRGVLEVFANDGLGVMTFAGDIFSTDRTLRLDGDSDVAIVSFKISEMTSIWGRQK
jgi:sucrose-6-phosphate hydrolase SacC (GH32 family)